MRKVLAFAFLCISFFSFSQVTFNICHGTTGTLTAPNPSNLASPAYSFNPGGVTNSQPTFVVSPTITSTYTLYTTGTYTDNSVITTSAVVTLSVLPTPQTSLALVQPTCNMPGASFSLNLTFLPSGTTPGYTIYWAGSSAGTFSPQIDTYTNVLPGAYSATIIADNGCGRIQNFTVNNVPAPATFSFNPAFSVFSITCANATQTVEVSNPALTYTWNSTVEAPFNGTTAAFTNTTIASGPTNYTVIAEHPISGCQFSRTLSVVSNTAVPNFNINPVSQNITCSVSAPQTVTLTAITPTVNGIFLIDAPDAPNTYTYYQQVSTFPPGRDGVHTVTFQNTSNGCVVVKTFTVNANQGYPSFTLATTPGGFTLGCNSKSLTIFNFVNPQSNTPGGGVTQNLLYPGAPFSTVTTSQLSYSVTVAGTYTAILVDNISKCVAVVPFSILDQKAGPPIDTIFYSRRIVDCDSASAVLVGNSPVEEAVAWTWNAPGGNLIQNKQITAVANTTASNQHIAGIYTVTATYPLPGGSDCSSVRTFTVLQSLYTPSFAVIQGKTLTCTSPTNILVYNGSSRIPNNLGLPNGKGPVADLWEGPSPQEPLKNSTSYTVQTPGIYTITARDLDNGCKSTTFVTVGDNIQYPLLNTSGAAPLGTLDCGSSSVSVGPDITPPTTGFSYAWTIPSTASVLATSITNSRLTSFTPGTFTILVTNTLNGCASTATSAVVNGSLTASIAAGPEKGFAKPSLEVQFFNNSFSSNGTNSITTIWSFGQGSTLTTKSAGESPIIKYTQPGRYVATAWVSKGSCLSTATTVVTVEAPSRLTVPNIFSPDGDGINDVYWLSATNLSSIDMMIYDRWGHLVYSLQTTKGQVAWDGKNQYGKECSPGVYFYVLKATGTDEEPYEMKGSITLVR